MYAVITLIDAILQIYTWIVIVYVIMTWLVQFNVMNMRNQFVAMIGNVLHRLTEPVLRPIRKIMPDLGGLDISPVVLLLALFFIRNLIVVDVGYAVR